MISNALIKRKFSKAKPVFDETLLGLFLSRLKVIGLAHSLELRKYELNYLESKDILEHIIEMPTRNPIMFLNSMQGYFNLHYSPEFVHMYRQDKYSVLARSIPLSKHDIAHINMSVSTCFTLKEHAYFILARKVSYN